MWYRVFSVSDAEPRPDALLAHLNRFAEVRGHFRGDAAGWFHADLLCGDTALSLDRYTADEDGIRAELNAWAASVEAVDEALAARLALARQLFALERPDGTPLHPLCVALCEHLARVTDGVIHIDGEGFRGKRKP